MGFSSQDCKELDMTERLTYTYTDQHNKIIIPWIFPREEYWNGLPFPSLGHLLDPGMESVSPALAGRFFTTEPSGKPHGGMKWVLISPAHPEP